MAPFDENGGSPPLDFFILRDGGIALYKNPQFIDEDMDSLTKLRYQIYTFDCRRWVSPESMHADWQTVLSFPGYYGRNLNALRDCLSDVTVPDSGGLALIFRRFDAYYKEFGAAQMRSGRTEAEVILDILAETSRYFLLFGKRFLTLIQTDDPTTHFSHLGAVSTHWNRREWLNKNRGL